MGVDPSPVHSCLLEILDALVQLGEVVLSENQSTTPALGEEAGNGKEAGESTTPAKDVEGKVIP
jgi:hypothetical protein